MDTAKKFRLTWLGYVIAAASFLSALAVITSGTLLNDIQTKELAKTIRGIEFIQGPDSAEFWVGCPMLMFAGFCLLTTVTQFKTVTVSTFCLGLICKFLCIFGLVMEGPDLYHIRLIKTQNCTEQHYKENCDEVNKLYTLYCTMVVFFIISINITFVAMLSCFTALSQTMCPVSRTNNYQYPLQNHPSEPPAYTLSIDDRESSSENVDQQMRPPPYSRDNELSME